MKVDADLVSWAKRISVALVHVFSFDFLLSHHWHLVSEGLAADVQG